MKTTTKTRLGLLSAAGTKTTDNTLESRSYEGKSYSAMPRRSFIALAAGGVAYLAGMRSASAEDKTLEGLMDAITAKMNGAHWEETLAICNQVISYVKKNEAALGADETAIGYAGAYAAQSCCYVSQGRQLFNKNLLVPASKKLTDAKDAYVLSVNTLGERRADITTGRLSLAKSLITALENDIADGNKTAGGGKSGGGDGPGGPAGGASGGPNRDKIRRPK